MRRGCLFLAAGLAAVLLLGGCNEGPWLFTSRQAREHLENRYPGEAIQMRKRGLNNWVCWFEDLPEAVFQISIATRGGDPVPAYHNVLSSNAPEVVWNYYLNSYLKEGGCLDAWEIQRARMDGSAYLSLEYTSMEQVRTASEQLQAFYRWTEGKPHRAFLQAGSYYFSFADSLLPWDSLSDSIRVCTQGPEDSLDDITAQCAGKLMEYYAFYNLSCADFTREELAAFAAERWDWVTMDGLLYIWEGEEPFPAERFAGIGADHRLISYGGLYEMLIRLGMEVEGTPEHFSFIGADGAAYEFSYDFCREVRPTREKDPHITWYYLRNGYMVDNTNERLWDHSWRDYGPLLRLTMGQSFQKDENHFGWEFMADLITGLRFREHP